MLPFLATFMDFDSSEETYQRYDKMSAYELFKICGVSKVSQSATVSRECGDQELSIRKY